MTTNHLTICLQNLALSDLLFVTICIPPTAVDYAAGWPFGLRVCRVVQYLIHVSTYREEEELQWDQDRNCCSSLK